MVRDSRRIATDRVKRVQTAMLRNWCCRLAAIVVILVVSSAAAPTTDVAGEETTTQMVAERMPDVMEVTTETASDMITSGPEPVEMDLGKFTTSPVLEMQMEHDDSRVDDEVPDVTTGSPLAADESEGPTDPPADDGVPELTTGTPLTADEPEGSTDSPANDVQVTTILPDSASGMKSDVAEATPSEPPLSIGEYLRAPVPAPVVLPGKESTRVNITSQISKLPIIPSAANEAGMGVQLVNDATDDTTERDALVVTTDATVADQNVEENAIQDVIVATTEVYPSGIESDSADDPEDSVQPVELVQIFDPSDQPEATTYLAEANQQTESDLLITTEAFQLDETLITTTEEPNPTTDVNETLPIRLQPSPATSSSSIKRSYKGYKVYRVLLPTEESVRRILSMEDEPGVEFWADPRLLLRPRGLFVTSAADIMVAPQTAPRLEEVFRQARLLYSVLLEDVGAAIIKENPKGPSFARSQVNPTGSHRLTWERYHRLSDINSFLDYLKEAHPDWIQVMPIGKSSQGRPINVIKVSSSRSASGQKEANGSNKKKKAILIDAGVHANEWITPAALTWMVNELVGSAADDYQCILDRFDWYFIPMVNPDGYEYSHTVDRMWRKTRRIDPLPPIRARKQRVDDGNEECIGVDLNANFEFNWRKGNTINACSPTYAGRKPFSEPESRAVANFMLKLRPQLAMYISLHSYSQMWLLPWGFTETRPEDFSQLYSLAKYGAKALQRVHNTTYLIGSVPDLLAVASGTSQDWAKGVAGVEYSYTLEMRDAGEKGMILPAQQIIPTSEETWAGIYAAAQELAHRLYPYSPSCAV